MQTQIVKPYHKFNHKGIWYLINIEDMQASIIDETSVKTLDSIAAIPGISLKPTTEALLKKLCLLSDEDKQDSKIAQTQNKKEIIPIVSIALFLIQSCNLKCLYCYGDAGSYGHGGRMDKKTAFQSVDWLIKQSLMNKKIHVGFFGGEPFINFTLMKAVVEYAKNRSQEVGKEVNFNITTNGTLLDDEKIGFINEHNMSVTISIDGPREIQDFQRPFTNGKGTYDTVVRNSKKLLEVVPNTSAHAVSVGNTDPQQVKDALLDIGFKKVSITLASISLFNRQTNSAKPNRDTEYVLEELEQESEAWLQHTKNRDSKLLQKLKSKSQLYPAMICLLHNSKRRYACGAGLSVVAVSCVGEVYLCHRFVGMDDYKLGTVFENVLNRDAYQKPATNNEPCIICFAKHYCAGGCKHDNVGSCGTVFMPAEDKCRLRRREFKLAAILVGTFNSEDHAFLLEHNIVDSKSCPFDF